MIAQSHEGIGRAGGRKTSGQECRDSNRLQVLCTETERQLVEGLPQGYVRHEWLTDTIGSPYMARAVLLW